MFFTSSHPSLYTKLERQKHILQKVIHYRPATDPYHYLVLFWTPTSLLKFNSNQQQSSKDIFNSNSDKLVFSFQL